MKKAQPPGLKVNATKTIKWSFTLKHHLAILFNIYFHCSNLSYMQERIEDLFRCVIIAKRVLKGNDKGIVFVDVVEAGVLSDVLVCF